MSDSALSRRAVERADGFRRDDPLITLDAVALDRLFPFHVRIDTDFRIVGLGRVVRRLLPGCVWRTRLDEAFDIERPAGISSFRDLAEARDCGLLMHSVERLDLKLKGEAFLEPDRGHIVLLTVPWISDPKMVDRLDLRVGDFSLWDATPDLMFLIETQRALLKDAEQMTESLRAARDEAVTANRAKSEFLANMSHELRTPLNAIIGFSDYLITLGADQIPGRFREYIADIHKSGRFLLAIVNDLLDLARIEAGRIALEEQPVELGALARDIAGSMRQLAAEKQVSLEMADGDGRVVVRADARLMRQVLLNLVSNAIKFNKPGGRVAIAVARADHDEIRIVVTDTGIGVDPAVIPELFQPFRQADSRIARSYGGTGLGLSIVRQIVRLHQGDVTMTSRPGEGTEVTVRLPCDRVLSGPEADTVHSVPD